MILAASISCQTRDLLSSLVYSATRMLAINVYETLQLCLCIRESRDLRHHRLFVFQRRLARQSSLSRSMHLSHRFSYAILHQSSDLAALFQQFAFHSLVIFHVFLSQSLQHSYTEHLHMKHSHTLQHRFTSKMS